MTQRRDQDREERRDRERGRSRARRPAPAIVDACFGQEAESLEHASGAPSRRPARRARRALAPEHHGHERRRARAPSTTPPSAHQVRSRSRRTSRSPGRSGSRRAAADRPAMPILPSAASTSAEAQVARRVLDAEEVARDAARPASATMIAAGVRELLRLSGPRRSGSRPPSVSARRSPPASPVRKCQPCVGARRARSASRYAAFFAAAELRRLARVEADRDDVELLARRRSDSTSSALDEAVQHQRAEHRALVVDERRGRPACSPK